MVAVGNAGGSAANRLRGLADADNGCALLQSSTIEMICSSQDGLRVISGAASRQNNEKILSSPGPDYGEKINVNGVPVTAGLPFGGGRHVTWRCSGWLSGRERAAAVMTGYARWPSHGESKKCDPWPWTNCH